MLGFTEKRISPSVYFHNLSFELVLSLVALTVVVSITNRSRKLSSTATLIPRNITIWSDMIDAVGLMRKKTDIYSVSNVCHQAYQPFGHC